MRVLSEMIERSVDTIAAFERTFQQHGTKAKTRAAEEKQWIFMIPLLVETSDDVRLPVRIKVLRRTVTFRSWSSVMRVIGSKRITKALSDVRNFRDAVRPDVCFSLKGSGADVHAAWRAVGQVFDVLRGSLELTVGYMRKRLRFPEGPLRTIPHPPWKIAWNQADKVVQAIDFIINEDDLNPRPRFVMKHSLLRTVASNINRFVGNQRDERDSRSIVADALRLYSQALDSSRYFQCFLGFWQCAESLSLASQHGGSGEKTCTRLAVFAQRWGIDKTGISDVLKSLYGKRNELVHRGIHDQISLDDVNLLKTFCESALVWVMQNSSRVRTRAELERFYEFNSLNDSAFDAIQRAIRVVRRERRSRYDPKRVTK